jgi:hypothetical protein
LLSKNEAWRIAADIGLSSICLCVRPPICARKVVQGIRQGLKAGHLPDRKKRKGWKKHTFSE